jgi:hypothetical protein
VEERGWADHDVGEDGVGADVEVSCDMVVQGVRARSGEVATRPEELSTKITFLREGIWDEVTEEAERSSMRDSSIGTLERGCLKGRFVSAPMMRCVAERWLNAEAICVALKAGLRGTRIAPSLNSAYVTVANSMLLPRCTQTRSPFCTPKLCSPFASTLLLTSSSWYVDLVFWCLEITAGRSP